MAVAVAVAVAVAKEIELASEADFQGSRYFEKAEAGDSSSWRAYSSVGF